MYKMSLLASSLSLNLNQLLQKKVQIYDLQYDYCCKYLAVGCRSQSGPELVILEKDGGSSSSPSLNLVNTISTRCDPVLLSWAPAKFGRVLIVVLSDNTVVYYRGSPSGGSGNFSVYHESKDVLKSISCMGLGVSPSGELLCAVGSPNGTVAVIIANSSFDKVGFEANYGGVTSVSFMGQDGCLDGSNEGRQCLLATGGMDNGVKVWEMNGSAFQLLSTLSLKSDSKCLLQVRSLSWNKNGNMLAVGTTSEVFVFEHVMNGSAAQRISMPRTSSKVCVAFNNDRLVVSCDGEGLVYSRDESGTYVLSNTLEE